MRLVPRLSLVLLAALSAASLLTPPVCAQVSLTTLGTPYTQSFDSLPASGSATWTNDSTIPGWFHARTGTGNTIVANNGSSNAGNLYSYGTGTATDRALGSVGSGNAAVGNIFWGLRLQNNTGATITALDIAYTGEQWRNSAAAAQTVAFSYLVGSPTVTGSLAEFQSAGVAVPSLDLTSPITGGAAGALDGNLAANRVTLTFSIGGLSIPNGTEVMLRWSDPDHTGADHGLSIDDFGVTPQGGAPLPNLTVTDVSLNEGDAGPTTFTFSVNLSAPAGPGGVVFDISTADGTAEDGNPVGEDNDYVAKSLTGQTIPAGSSSFAFNLTVNGDTTPETDETFFVNVTNVTGANVTDGQGQGTIVNDDLARIHDVQGNGAATPIPGATVMVEGVVTANFQGTGRLRGFFLQEEDVDADADPATSEGIFVFCNSCPTPVAEGQRVQVTGTVSEFFNMTQITASTAPSVVVTDAGSHLAEVTPAPIDLPVVGVIDDFYEPKEGMLVTFIDTLTVAEYFELARFGHLELYEGGRPRQFTETSPPSVAGLTAHLDNLDRRRVVLDDDNNRQNAFLPAFGGPPDGSQSVFHPQANGGFSIGAQGIDFFRGGDLVNGLTGVLHWSFPGTGADTWRIRPTAAAPAAFTVANPRPATPPAVGGAIRAVSMNLLNYFTTIDTTASSSTGPCGPAGTQDCRGADSVAEVNRQRERISIVVCGLDAHVYAFNELENTTATGTITDLVGAINARCGGADPFDFVDTGGTLGTDAIRVALIYRSATLSPVGSPLVDLDPVHNRPPTAQTFHVIDPANPASGERFTVIANHFKSKGGCPGSGPDADAMDGASCFNAQRTDQATRLLTWISSTVLPAAGDPDVLLLGDFNSYAQETPVTTLAGAGFTDLESAILGPNAYSFLFDGQLGHLDYAFSSSSLTPQVTGIGAWHVNADEAPIFDYSDEVFDSPGEANFEEKPDGSALVPPRIVFQPASPYRAADHDPILVGLFHVADLSITKVEGEDPVTAGTNLAYTITVSNGGPDPAGTVSWSDTLPTGTTFVSLTEPGGWSCNTPMAGSGGLVSCSTASLAVGSAAFTLTVAVAPGVAAGTDLSNEAEVTSATGDPDTDDLSATETTTVAASADLSASKSDSVDPILPGATQTYAITVTNGGPSDAASASWTDTLPAGTTFLSLSEPGGWTCNTPMVGSGGMISCSIPSLAVASPATFTLQVVFDTGLAGGALVTNTATASSATPDAQSGNDDGSAETTVSTAGSYFAVTPCRAVDTRAGLPLQNGVPRTFALHGACGIPASATSVALNVTVVSPTGDGDLTVHASDATAPSFSTMPFRAGRTRALIVFSSLSQDVGGEVVVQVAVAGNGTVHILLDVMGYFE